MALDVNVGGTTGNQQEVDSNHNAFVNLPVIAVQAGFVQLGYVRDSTMARVGRVTEEGEAYGAVSRILFQCDFNNPGALINTQFDQTATTMTLAASGGFLRMNNGASAAATVGVQLKSWRVFCIEDGSVLRGKFHLRHTNGSVANKQADIGFGYANPASGQGTATNEFVGFRWTLSGALLGIVEYSASGGAPTSLTVNINGGVPLSDNVSREYEVIISDNVAEFWIGNVYQASINFAADAPGLLKGNAYPIFMRLFNSASVPALAPIFDIGDVSVIKVGFEADIPVAYRQALMGRHLLYNQPGLGTANGSPFITAASGTAPTAGTPSNTAANATSLGGFNRINATSVVVTAHTNLIITDYTNPAIPTAQGAGNDVRNLIITDIVINPLVVSGALTTQAGAIALQWFIAIGSTAVSLATTDAAGTTAPGTKAPRIFPLPMTDTFASAPAVGTVGTRMGSSVVNLQTPLVVHPGEHVEVGVRILVAPSAAATAGTYDGSTALSGYWD